MNALSPLCECILSVKRLRWLTFAALLCAGAAFGARPFPKGVERAYMDAPPAANRVTLDGKTFQLAPGAQIRDRRDLIVMPPTVTEPALVRYLIDAHGRVSRIWILTPEEAEQPDDD